MGFVKKYHRSHQPQQPVGLDPDHWIVKRGISYLGSPTFGNLNGRNVFPSTVAGVGGEPFGLVSAFNGSNYQTFDKSVAGYPCTIGFWYKTGSVNTGSAGVSIGTTGTNDQRIALSFVVSTVRAELFTRTTAGTTLYSGSPGAFAANTWYFLVGVIASTTDARAYINGGNEGATASVNACTGATKTFIGAAVGATTTAAINGARIHLPFVLPWAMTAADVAQLYKEQRDTPWQIFAPRSTYIPVSAVGGGGTFKPAWARPRSGMIGAR